MSISKNIAQALQRYKSAQDLSVSELADELGVAKSILVEYLHGNGNPRADTVDLLAKKLDIPVMEIVSGPLPGQEQAETVVRAVQAISGLDPERRERAAQLFLELVSLFSDDQA